MEAFYFIQVQLWFKWVQGYDFSGFYRLWYGSMEMVVFDLLF